MLNKKQQGRSMVEMLGVLAIIGVLSIGGIAGYSMAMEKYRINQALESINLLSQQVRIMFASQTNYSGLGHSIMSRGNFTAGKNDLAATIIKNAGVTNLPYTLVVGEFDVGYLEMTSNQIGKPSTSLASPSSNTEEIIGFAVGFIGISEGVCVALYSHNWSVYGSELTGINDGYSDDVRKSYSVSEAISVCSQMTEDERSFIVVFNPTNRSSSKNSNNEGDNLTCEDRGDCQ